MKNMKSASKKFLGLWTLFRLMPVMSYSGSIVIMNAAAAYQSAGTAVFKPALILTAGAVIMNGLLAHSLNDIEDWRSGTDKVSGGILSGGSKVIKYGLFDRPELGRIAFLAVLFSLGIGIYFYILRGPLALAALAFGIFAAWSYTCPPLRLSYRPLLGEWICLLLAGTVLSAASYFVLTGGFAMLPFFAGAVHCMLVAGWIMQHHVPDLDADLAASPAKLTTPAYFYRRWGSRSVMVPSAMYYALALVMSLAGYRFIHPVFLWMASVAVMGIAAACSTRSRDLMDVTKKELYMIVLTMMDSLVFSVWILKIF